MPYHRVQISVAHVEIRGNWIRFFRWKNFGLDVGNDGVPELIVVVIIHFNFIVYVYFCTIKIWQSVCIKNCYQWCNCGDMQLIYTYDIYISRTIVKKVIHTNIVTALENILQVSYMAKLAIWILSINFYLRLICTIGVICIRMIYMKLAHQFISQYKYTSTSINIVNISMKMVDTSALMCAHTQKEILKKRGFDHFFLNVIPISHVVCCNISTPHNILYGVDIGLWNMLDIITT